MKYTVAWSAADGEYVATCDRWPSLSWLSIYPASALEGLRSVIRDVLSEQQSEFGRLLTEKLSDPDIRAAYDASRQRHDAEQREPEPCHMCGSQKWPHRCYDASWLVPKPCGYREPWRGTCSEPGSAAGGRCDSHAVRICSGCGEPATGDCGFAYSIAVCGTPLCDDCHHDDGSSPPHRRKATA